MSRQRIKARCVIFIRRKDYQGKRQKMKFRAGQERWLELFTPPVFLSYDFYMFTLVMICYIAFYSLYVLKFFWPAKAYQAILLQIGEFFGRNFTSQRESFRLKHSYRPGGPKDYENDIKLLSDHF